MNKAFVMSGDKICRFVTIQLLNPAMVIAKFEKRQWKPDVRAMSSFVLTFLLFSFGRISMHLSLQVMPIMY
jgi:hypothetical protein